MNEQLFGNNSSLGFGSGGSNDIDKRAEKQIFLSYKKDAEKALSSQAEGYLAAQRNQSEFYINQDARSSVVKFYNIYWAAPLVRRTGVAAIIMMAVAFHSYLAVIGYFIVSFMYKWWSHDAFMARFGRDVKVDKKTKKELQDMFFKHQLDKNFIDFWLIAGGAVSLFAIMFPKNFFLNPDSEFFKESLILAQNEFFAYSLGFFVLGLMLFKIQEIWKRDDE